MKYLVVLCDGMADQPIKELGNKTPIQKANKPNIESLAAKGSIGMVKTVADNMAPGSDVANLSVLGYDTDKYYTGRSPLEAVSMGINLDDNDITFRCNLVTLSDEENLCDKTMLDYSAGEITTEESHELISYLAQTINDDKIELYPGISYRHCLVWHNTNFNITLTPPHDITNKKIANYLPNGDNADFIQNLMKISIDKLKNHPINVNRIKNGKNPANCIWLWGKGKKAILDNFKDKYKLTGSVISAVDLIKGIAISAGMDSIDVDNATGTIHTNFKGKADAAIEQFKKGQDFVFVHLEAPDECGHQGQLQEKIESIELIDKKIVEPILNYLKNSGEDFSIMILPDHPTPISTRTHSREPVPFLIYRSNDEKVNALPYDEINAKESGLYIDNGYTLMDLFLEKK